MESWTWDAWVKATAPKKISQPAPVDDRKRVLERGRKRRAELAAVRAARFPRRSGGGVFVPDDDGVYINPKYLDIVDTPDRR
jgi:hypothetical protein